MDRVMDLVAVNKTSPLDLDGLLLSSEEDLLHDVFGIATHLDRSTGTLMDCFVPRYTKRQ